jgi:hypothetical protein
LALLTVADPPAVPVLAIALKKPDKQLTYAGFGYQNGQPSAGDLEVKFSTGSSVLRDILPSEALSELRQSQSQIDVDSEILRFNVALQPGMSGGPIVDKAGRVIGIVAGGLKAGAAPASWGWPSEWIQQLQASTQVKNQPVLLARAYYSFSEMDAVAKAITTGKSLTCGAITFRYHGERAFQDVARGADDEVRLRYIEGISGLPQTTIQAMRFETWVHEESGATVVTPARYSRTAATDACELRSTTGPFRQVVWGAAAPDVGSVQDVSTRFEQTVMFTRSSYQYGFVWDQALTTAGVQFRDNGLVFNRKGFVQVKQFIAGSQPAYAHTFETLIAKNGSFVGIGTINDDLLPTINLCNQSNGKLPGCGPVMRYLEEWTLFILATQLSTYPST